jgi:hypothetical protein
MTSGDSKTEGHKPVVLPLARSFQPRQISSNSSCFITHLPSAEARMRLAQNAPASQWCGQGWLQLLCRTPVRWAWRLTGNRVSRSSRKLLAAISKLRQEQASATRENLQSADRSSEEVYPALAKLFTMFRQKNGSNLPVLARLNVALQCGTARPPLRWHGPFVVHVLQLLVVHLVGTALPEIQLCLFSLHFRSFVFSGLPP